MAVEGRPSGSPATCGRRPCSCSNRGRLGLPAALTTEARGPPARRIVQGRGAVHRLLTAGAGPGTTVVAASGGNHGVAVAWAAAQIGCMPEIYIPSVSSHAKVSRLQAFGADVRVAGSEYADAAAAALRADRRAGGGRPPGRRGPPYDHPDIVAGAGTLGRELDHQAPGPRHRGGRRRRRRAARRDRGLVRQQGPAGRRRARASARR